VQDVGTGEVTRELNVDKTHSCERAGGPSTRLLFSSRNTKHSRTMSDELVTLMSSEGEAVQVAQEVAFKSETIKNMIEGKWARPPARAPFPPPDDLHRRSPPSTRLANDRRIDR
jgi:hypothetical protein